jgi:RTX calcium-binding nonapeptide repeat (4 copies)
MVIATGLVPATARAACPGLFAGQPVNAGGTYDICTYAAGVLTCNLAANGASSDTSSWYVMASNTSFRAYGTAGNGNRFCFEQVVDDTCGGGNQHILNVNGTEMEDVLRLRDDIDGNQMKCAVVTVNGDYQNDFIYGSEDTSAIEYLYGGAESDSIWGRAGNDTIDGGDGADTLYGGPGNDTITGGAGEDRLKGGTGTDLLYGGDDGDDVCGEGDADSLYGEDGLDVLYGGADDDTILDGGAGEDACETDLPVPGCETFGIVACPW